MSSLRHPFRIVVDGTSHDIVTSARDFAAVNMDVDEAGHSMASAAVTWTMLHAACMRLEVSGVPHDLDKFIDLLDEVIDLDGIPIGISADPIQPAATEG